MSATLWTHEQTERARKTWNAYQREHDLSAMRGQIAAVDPETGRVWIGESAVDALDRMEADGVNTPVWFVRVGYDHFTVKGRR